MAFGYCYSLDWIFLVGQADANIVGVRAFEVLHSVTVPFGPMIRNGFCLFP
jgi:hypothetical protein